MSLINSGYNVEYRFNFLSQGGDEFVIDISTPGYTGGVKERALGATPILSMKDGDSHIKAMSLKLIAESVIDNEFISLYSSDYAAHQVVVYRNGDVIFSGFVEPELYAAPVIASPYDVEVIAIDGLSSLKHKAALDLSGISYRGYLNALFALAGYNNISTEDVILESQLKNAGVFFDLDNYIVSLAYDEEQSAYAQMQLLLSSINAVLWQQGGVFRLTRESDLGDSVPSVSEETCKPIGKMDVEVIPAKRDILITSRIEKKDSILENSDFKESTSAPEGTSIIIDGVPASIENIYAPAGWTITPLSIVEDNKAGTYRCEGAEWAKPMIDLYQGNILSDTGALYLYYRGSASITTPSLILEADNSMPVWRIDLRAYIYDGALQIYITTDKYCYAVESGWYEVQTSFGPAVEYTTSGLIEGVLEFPAPPEAGAMQIELVCVGGSINEAKPLIQVDKCHLSRIIGDTYVSKGNLNPGALGSAEDVTLGLIDGDVAGPNTSIAVAKIMYRGITPTSAAWTTPRDNTPRSIVDTMCGDYALAAKIARLRIKGTIGLPGGLALPRYYECSDTAYIIHSYEWNLYDSELSIEGLSLIYGKIASIEIESAIVTSAEAKSASTPSVSNGGGGVKRYAQLSGLPSLEGVTILGDLRFKDISNKLGVLLDSLTLLENGGVVTGLKFDKHIISTKDIIAYLGNGESVPTIPIIPIASANSVGGVKINGNGLEIDEDGLLRVVGGSGGASSWDEISGKPTFATVATSGSYNDLSNKPALFSGNYNDLSNKPTIPTNTNQLTNGAGYITGITSSMVTTALGYTPYNSSNPSGYITSSALSGYATQTWVNNKGYITGITKAMVTTALGYTPPTTDTNTWRPLGTTADTACAGNDSRLSNARPANGGNADTLDGYHYNGLPYLSTSGGTVSGNITANHFYKASDDRLKIRLQDYNVSLSVISQIPSFLFQWKDSKRGQDVMFGTSAQSLESLGLNQFVHTNTEGEKSVSYDMFGLLAISALKEVYNELNILKQRLNLLEGR